MKYTSLPSAQSPASFHSNFAFVSERKAQKESAGSFPQSSHIIFDFVFIGLRMAMLPVVVVALLLPHPFAPAPRSQTS